MTKQYATIGEALDARRNRNDVGRTLQDAHEAGELKKANARFRNIRHAHKPFEKLTDEEFRNKYWNRTHRTGKTERDHRNGAPQRAAARRAARAQWQSDAKFNSVPAFPG